MKIKMTGFIISEPYKSVKGAVIATITESGVIDKTPYPEEREFKMQIEAYGKSGEYLHSLKKGDKIDIEGNMYIKENIKWNNYGNMESVSTKIWVELKDE